MPTKTKTLSEFGKCTMALKEWLKHDTNLDLVDQVFSEDHLQLATFTYGAWKRRHSSKQEQDVSR